MLIHHPDENIWDTRCEAIVVTVNCEGAMGKGIALECKLRYPEVYGRYRQLCVKGVWHPGRTAVSRANNGQWLILASTKDKWRERSRVLWTTECMQRIMLIQACDTYNFQTIALPPLGCGNGDLNRDDFINAVNTRWPANQLHLYYRT